MDILNEFGTDVAKEQDGVAVEMGDATFVIARSGSHAYNTLISKLFKANKRALDMQNEASQTLSDNLMAEVLAKTVLKGWSGVTEKGVEVPYSAENALRYLRIKDFRAFVAEKANDFTLYKSAVDEEVTGN